MTPGVFALFLAVISIQKVDLAGLKANRLILDGVTGPPPVKSHFLSENSGSRIRRSNRHGPPGLNILLNITTTIPNGTTISTRLFERHSNAFKSVLAEYKTNLCDYLAHEKRRDFIVFKEIMKFPSSCPLGPGIYKVDNWQLSEMLPRMLPVTEGFKLTTVLEFTKEDYIVNSVFLKIGRQ